MNEYFKLIISLLFPLIIGLVFTSVILPRKEQSCAVERLAISFLLGSGVLTIEMLLIGAFGMRINVMNIVLLTSFVILLPLIRVVATKSTVLGIEKLGSIKLNIFDIFFLTMITLRILYVIFEDLVKPVVSVDAFANWSLRAKVFFVDGGLALSKNSAIFAGGGQTFYPIHIPLLETWVFNVLGIWDDRLVKAIFPLFFISLLIIFYYAIKRITGFSFAIFSTYLLSTLPMLVHHATIEYSDLIVAIYLASSVLFLLRSFDENDDGFFYLSALLGGIATWTKSEGMPFLMVNFVVIYIFSLIANKDSKFLINKVLGYFALAMIFKLPWSLVNIVNKIPKNVWQKIEYNKLFANADRLPVIFDQFYKKFLFYGNWNIAWFVLLIVLVFSFNKLKDLKKLLPLTVIVLYLAAFLFLYYLTPSYAWLLDGTTLNRNTLIIMPILIYFISINLYDILNEN
jgi:hypothetical protein